MEREIRGPRKDEMLCAAREYIAASNTTRPLSLGVLSKKYKCKRATISKYVKYLGGTVENHSTCPGFNRNVFDIIDTEEKAYWLGFLYADGCITENNYIELGVHTQDYDVMQKYRKFLDFPSDESIKFVKNKNVCRVRFHNDHVADMLVQKGCVRRKSLILTFPDLKIFSNTNLVYDFIRGYCDGDGCLRFYKNGKGAVTCDISFVGTKPFIQKMMEFLNVPGGVFRNCSSKNNITEVYSVLYRCTSGRKVARLLYENATVYMNRKYNKFLEFCRFEQECSRAKSSKISRRWDANTEVSSEITKGSETPQRVGIE